TERSASNPPESEVILALNAAAVGRHQPMAASGAPSSGGQQRELDRDRNVVRGLLPCAHMLLDRCASKAVGGFRRQQQVVNADAVVLLPGAGLVVPEGVERPVADGPD